MVLVLREMQSVSSRIWTRVAVSISYDDNHYTTGTSKRYCDKYIISWVILKRLNGYTYWPLTKHMEKKLNENYSRYTMLRALLNEFWMQYAEKQQLYVSRTRNAEQRWWRMDELISVGRPVKTSSAPWNHYVPSRGLNSDDDRNYAWEEIVKGI